MAVPFYILCLLAVSGAFAQAQTSFMESIGERWTGYGRDAQHTGLSPAAAQALNNIHWSTPVDLGAVASGPLLVHYGSPVITQNNTVLVPVRTGAAPGFEILAFNGATGTWLYTLTTDYLLPAHDWVPPYGPALSVSAEGWGAVRRVTGRAQVVARALPLKERLYYPGAGGTVYYRDGPDSSTGPSGQIAFYGSSLYAANKQAFDGAVQISTPIVADETGNVYFGFTVTQPNPANLLSGIARIGADGTGAWVSAQAVAGGDLSIAGVALNCTPALSNDGSTLYVAVSNGDEFGTGYLVSANSQTLAPIAHVALLDPRGGLATVSSDSSASPTVGPDGDVYYGVLEGNCCSSHNDRGWMLHFNAGLTQTKIPGSFGWDASASVVPAKLVPSYTGTSSYLILTKYNNYVDTGTGDGVNKVAVLDPAVAMADPVVGSAVQVMKEVITIVGQTPDPSAGFPNAVREWCINTAAVDSVTGSAVVNSEDGVVYRWNFATNSLTQRKTLTAGRGESYTPTAIGVDGTVYAINDGILFAIGN